MGIVYTAAIDDVSVSTTGDILQLLAGSVRGCRILEWELTSSAVAAEDLRLYTEFADTAGSGGTGLSEVALNRTFASVTADAAASVLNSTPASTVAKIKGYRWEQLGPLGQVYTPETRPELGVGDVFVIVLATAPAASITIGGSITWEEG